jgi:hypothetical protein
MKGFADVILWQCHSMGQGGILCRQIRLVDLEDRGRQWNRENQHQGDWTRSCWLGLGDLRGDRYS